MNEIELYESVEKGTEVRAARDFAVGEEVLTFEGIVTDERGVYTLQIGLFEHLLVSEPWRFVNHSCDPNCGIKNKTTLVAIKPIKKGDPITFDYAMTEQRLFHPFECSCGSEKCRGMVGGFDSLPDDIRRRYHGYFSDYLT
ncbi:MAG: SET domain-containing protein-lysine N-methyltransferase [Candidatus Gracilibacteria bacterium]|jgi:hypothetical protein